MDIKMIPLTLMAVFLSMDILYVQGAAVGDSCQTLVDCDTSTTLMTCNKAYTTCTHGVCACPSTHSWDSGNSKCAVKTTLYFDKDCSSSDTAALAVTHAVCSSGKVTCETDIPRLGVNLCQTGVVKTLTDDCTASDQCWYYDSTSGASLATCNDIKKCSCNTGYTAVGKNCVQNGVGADCSTDLDCPLPYQTCTAEKCACETGTIQSGTVCITNGLIPEGTACTYQPGLGTIANTALTCAYPLECQVCPEDTSTGSKKCVRPVYNPGQTVHPVLLHLVSAVFIALFGKIIL